MTSKPLLVLLLTTAIATVACESPQKFATTMEVIQIEPLHEEGGGISRMSLELRYADCPGDTRRVLRADRAFAACGAKLNPGDRVKAELVSTWQSDKGLYRSEIVRLGECALKQDPKDDANYELVQTCSDVVATGAVIGVRCERARTKALVDRCPWLRRR